METVIDKQSEIAIFGLKTSLQLEEGLFVFFLWISFPDLLSFWMNFRLFFVKRYRRDTTIAFSSGFCDTFWRKMSCLGDVSENKQRLLII